MSNLIIGTDEGAFRLEHGQHEAQPEEGPPSVGILANASTSTFAVTREGALWERDPNGDWLLINKKPVSEEVWSLGVDPRLPGRMYLGVSPALLHISDDKGKSWRACDSIRRIPDYSSWTFPPPPHVAHVRTIAPDPMVAGGVYIGVEEGGIFHSADGGNTWQNRNNGLNWDVHTVIPTPDGNVVYATTGFGFHRSEDSGCHWKFIVDRPDRSYTVPCVMSSRNPQKLYTGAAAEIPPAWANGANAALYRTHDGGETWTQLTGGLPSHFDVMVWQMGIDDDDGVYASSGRQLFASDDEGETWRQIAGQFSTIRAMAAA